MMFPNTKLNSKAPSFPTTSPSNSSVSRSALSGTLSSSPPLFLSKIDLLAQMAEFQTTGTSPNYTTNSSTSSDYFHQNNFLTNNFSSRTLDTTSTTTKQSLMSSSFSSIDNIGKTKSERASFSSSIETLNNHCFCSSADSNEALYKLDLEFGTGDFSLPDFSESPLLQPASVDHDSPVPVVGCVNAGWCLDSNTSSSANRVILPPPTILVPSATSTTESSPVQEYTEQSIFSSPGLLPQIAISSSPILLPDEKQLQARAEEIKRLEQAKIEAESTALAFNQTVKEIMSNNDNADYRKKSPVISLRSFDSNNHLDSIPLPILNAICFSPRSAVIVSSEDEDVGFSDMDSIFSADVMESPAHTLYSQPEHSKLQNEASDELNEEEDFEQGRLFIRVESISGLTLPIPSNSQSPRIIMSLNNCKQSVSIDPIPIKSTDIAIGQEFELVVGKQDFDITLEFRAEMRDAPIPKATAVADPTTNALDTYKQHARTPSTTLSPALPVGQSSPKKQSRLRTMFKSTSMASLNSSTGSPHSPKRTPSTSSKSHHSSHKRKVDPATTPITVIPNNPPRIRKLWDGLTGPSGEFAQTVITYDAASFQNPLHEAFGRPASVVLPLMNEWAYNDPYPTVQTRMPVEAFAMGRLQVTLMFVPGSENVPDQYYPDSIADAVTQYTGHMEQAQSSGLINGKKISGYLTQEGGSCRYWRRRWFELHGTTLVGHTDDTKKVRTIIDLTTSILLAGSLTQDDDYDEYLFNKDKLFRLGVVTTKDTLAKSDGDEKEIIQFMADTPAQRDMWVRALGAAISHSQALASSWVGTVVEATAKTATTTRATTAIAASK